MRGRRLIGGTAAALLALLLSGCTEMDANALTRVAGRPAVVNCGSWIRSVSVSDADSHRLVWSAQVTSSRSTVTTSVAVGTTSASGLSERFTVGQVELGTIPSRNWEERGRPELDPPPTRWQFVINGSVTMVANDSDLQEDRYFARGHNMSFDDFRDEVCNDNPAGIRTLASYVGWTLLVILAVTPMILIPFAIRRNRRDAAREPGYYQLHGQWRYWNGSRWN